MAEAIPERALVVVADGGKAILFRNTGKGGTLSLTEETRLTPHTLAAEGPSGTQPPEHSPKDTGEAAFISQLAHRLDHMRGRNDFSDLVLVADPQSLGQLRSALPKPTMKCVVASLSKDLTNHSAAEIEAALG